MSWLRYTGLTVISQLDGSRLPKGVPSIGRGGQRSSGRGDCCSSAAFNGLLVSTRGGAWHFRDPQPACPDAQIQTTGGLHCTGDFSFRLLRQL